MVPLHEGIAMFCYPAFFDTPLISRAFHRLRQGTSSHATISYAAPQQSKLLVCQLRKQITVQPQTLKKILRLDEQITTKR